MLSIHSLLEQIVTQVLQSYGAKGLLSLLFSYLCFCIKENILPPDFPIMGMIGYILCQVASITYGLTCFLREAREFVTELTNLIESLRNLLNSKATKNQSHGTLPAHSGQEEEKSNES
jgi:hypothetical protein